MNDGHYSDRWLRERPRLVSLPSGSEQRLAKVVRRLFAMAGYGLILTGVGLGLSVLGDQAQFITQGRIPATAKIPGAAVSPEVKILADGFGPAGSETRIEAESARFIEIPPGSEEEPRAGLPLPAELQIPASPDLLPTRVLIPDLDVDSHIVPVPLQEGTWNLRNLGAEVAYLEGTGSLGKGNLVLAAHIILWGGGEGPFRNISMMQPGDIIAVYQDNHVYRYQVREQSLVAPSDVSLVMPTSHPTLTLLTCASWDAQSRKYMQRLAVIAELFEEGTP